MTWEELEAVLRAKRHTDELSALRAEVARETSGVKGSRQKVLEASVQVQLADLVSGYLEGKSIDGVATERYVLARKVASALLQDVKRGTDRQLQRIALPSPDRLVEHIPRGTQRLDIISALGRLEESLRDEGGMLRVVGDRESFTVIYRETGATAASLAAALGDLAGKLERMKK